MKDRKVLTIIIVLAIVFTILGGTLAYWSWTSNNTQKTNVTFTVGANFSCSADGGGTITNTSYFVPTECTNSTYAIQKTITTSITNSGNEPVYLDMWLTVNSIGSGLASSSNFKYALTTSSNSCTTNVLAQGNFNGKQANDTIPLLTEVTSAGTYYLYVWLDAAETSASTQNQSVSLSLGGECTDEAPNYTYTVNLYDANATGYNLVWIGQPIPSGITEYTTPGDAITALETAYSNANSGATKSLPFFLRHKIASGTVWCATNGTNTYCIYETQTECNTEVTNDWGSGYTCTSQNYTDGVSESYVGFTVTPTMAANNTGMTAGTYYLKGGDNGRSYNANTATLLSAFGSTYCIDYSSYFNCEVSGLDAGTSSFGIVIADDGAASSCAVAGDGDSYCNIPLDDGGGSIVEPGGPK